MTEKQQLNTPVLFLIFNRPKSSFLVFEAIRKAKPKQLFIASDGYRNAKSGEKDTVENLRKDIVEKIDWACEVKTLFRDENMGCKKAVSSAINWFFDHVEQGIILEDDCIPDNSFFDFCEEMLIKYKEQNNVLSICGYNPLGKYNTKNSYTFSRYFFSWGWATWKRAWKKVDIDFMQYQEIEKKGNLNQYFTSFFEKKIRTKKINDCLNGKSNSWAIPWNTTHQINHSLSVVPKNNLIKNIGFSEEFSTHTKENKWDMKFLDHAAQEMKKPIKHPEKIEVDKQFMSKYWRNELIRMCLKKIWK